MRGNETIEAATDVRRRPGTGSRPGDIPTVDLIAAARPNFMKVAPLLRVLLRQPWCRTRLVHTGQHYDPMMSDAFFRDLEIPAPDHHLGVGSGSHAEQTGGVMVAYEAVCRAAPPSWIVVVGDVNSTLACALVGAKLCIPVAHLEAGLRSGDRTMPEEINRIVTDAVADLLWTPSPDADANLRAEGVAASRIERVGNIMIDSYELMRDRIRDRAMAPRLQLARHGFCVVTLHRPNNVDEEHSLRGLVEQILAISRQITVVFPVHPRTRQRLEAFSLAERIRSVPGVRLVDPLGYIDFMSLVCDARLVITDSGGVQEETTYLGIPCLTVRPTTERPITVTEGTNVLIRPTQVLEATQRVLTGDRRHGKPPALWDGHTAERVAASLRRRLQGAARPQLLRARSLSTPA